MAILGLPAAMSLYSGAKQWGSESPETNKANTALAQEHNANVKNFLKAAIGYKLRGAVRVPIALAQLGIQGGKLASNLQNKMEAQRRSSIAGIQKAYLKTISSEKEQTLGGSRTSFRKDALAGLKKRHEASYKYINAVENISPFMKQQHKEYIENAQSRLYASVGALPPKPITPNYGKDDFFTRAARTVTSSLTAYGTGQEALEDNGALDFLPDALKNLKIG